MVFRSVNVCKQYSTKLTIRELLASITCSIFTEIHLFETIYQSLYRYRVRLIVICRMACIIAYLSHFYCMGTITMAGNNGGEP